jgi:hypothetical protein
VNISILIADDHPLVRDGVRFSIEASGKEIEIVGEAVDGLEVLQLAKQHPIDVFILDITMPCLNGLDTARTLRHQRRYRQAITKGDYDADFRPICDRPWLWAVAEDPRSCHNHTSSEPGNSGFDAIQNIRQLISTIFKHVLGRHHLHVHIPSCIF